MTTLTNEHVTADNFASLVEKVLESKKLILTENESLGETFKMIDNYIMLERAFKEKATLELDDIFDKTRNKVIRHYHSIILNDFLPKFISKSTIQLIISKSKKRIFRYSKTPFLPLEFSIAFFRFGHSLIRRSYLFKDSEDPQSIFSPKRINTPVKINIDWNRFFPNPKHDIDPTEVNRAGKIDAYIVLNMFNDLGIPMFDNQNTFSRNIAFRNIKRGDMHKLASGQDIGNELVKKNILSRCELVNSLINKPPTKNTILNISNFKNKLTSGLSLNDDEAEELMKNSPLWLYTLMEAEICENGDRLGPVAGRLIAEVIIGIIEHSQNAILSSQSNPESLNINQNGLKFTITDLLEYVDFYPPNPPTPSPPPPDTSDQ